MSVCVGGSSESAEKNGHNPGTEILTILFPPPEHPWIGELFESIRGLTG
jgi:hypothetical protein